MLFALEMVTLTKDIVLSRTHMPSLPDVKCINMWGQGISDISVCERLPNVEILSLSCNKICDLAPLQHCAALQELYLRKNEVQLWTIFSLSASCIALNECL